MTRLSTNVVHTKLYKKLTILLQAYNLIPEAEFKKSNYNRDALPYLMNALILSETSKRVIYASDFSVMMSLLGSDEKTRFPLDALHSLSSMLFDEGTLDISYDRSDLRSKAFRSIYLEFCHLVYDSQIARYSSTEEHERLIKIKTLLQIFKQKCEVLGNNEGLIKLIDAEAEKLDDRISLSESYA